MTRQGMRVVAAAFAALFALGTWAEAAPVKTTHHRVRHSSRVAAGLIQPHAALTMKKQKARRKGDGRFEPAKKIEYVYVHQADDRQLHTAGRRPRKIGEDIAKSPLDEAMVYGFVPPAA